MNDKPEEQPNDEALKKSAAAGVVASDEGSATGGGDKIDETVVPAAAAPDDRHAEKQAPAEPTVVVKKSSSALAFLALLIALGAVAGSGYVWYEQQAQKIFAARVEEVGRELDRRSADLERVLDGVQDLAQFDREMGDELASLTSRVERDLAGLPTRLNQLEATIEKVPGISQKARSAWLRSEAEYFLRVANAQLNLAGNVSVSLRALELADEQLRDLADPGLTPVREAISDERIALKAVPQPDAEGIVLTLGSLSRSLDSLPLANGAPTRYGAPDDGEAEASGWQRAWRVIVDALQSVVSIKRDDQAIEPLLTAAEESILIRSLDVDLQIARLAIIRSEGELFHHSLDAVSGRLRSYFDTSSPDVAGALTTLDDLARVELPEQLPDISTSLTLLLNARGEVVAQ